MINVQEIRRNVINVVKNYSDAQVKVRKATSNEPWGPSATLMSEIADLTYNVVAFSEIMQIIWKRLNDHGKNWRHVYKALVLLEYLIKTGSEKVAQQCRDNLFAIQTLKDFQYFEESKDQGLSIREKSKSLVNLLKDEEKLKVERSRALKAKERFSQSLSYMGNGSDTNEQPFKPSTSYPEALSQGETSRSLNSDLESARPHTVGEEKLQLEIALAMSKEEAEQEERIRKNDDLRLKLALEESEKNSQKSQINESHSAVDDLLSLNATPSTSASLLTTTNTVNAIVANDPWSSNCASGVDSVSTLLPSPPINKNRHQPILNQNDPWIPSKKAFESVTLDKKSSFEDPWGASNITSSFIPPENDPWSLNDPQQSENKEKSAKNDPWDSTFDSSKTDTTDPIEELREPISKTSISVDSNFSYQNNDITRRTPESFLGPNSNLVNLDALVSSKTQSSNSPNNNPFSAVSSSVVNPFQANKPTQPTINELRAQNNNSSIQMPGPSSASSLFSLSNGTSEMNSLQSQSFFGQNFSAAYPQLHPISSALGVSENSAWGGSKASAFLSMTPTQQNQQPNNPFAM